MTRLAGVILAAGLLAVPAVASESCEEPVTELVLKEVERINGRWYGRILVAKRTAGEVRAPLVDWALYENSAHVAEEMLGDFWSRNNEPREIEQAPHDLIELAKYRKEGTIDWERVDADFGHTDTIVELSRAGCDSMNAYGLVRVAYHFRKALPVPEGWLLRPMKDGAAGWRMGIMRSSARSQWDGSSCAQISRPPVAEYPELCAKFAR